LKKSRAHLDDRAAFLSRWLNCEFHKKGLYWHMWSIQQRIKEDGEL